MMRIGGSVGDGEAAGAETRGVSRRGLAAPRRGSVQAGIDEGGPGCVGRIRVIRE